MRDLLPERLRREIEAAYDYRGHVTIALKDGKSVRGFLYNRVYKNPGLEEDFFVDIFVKDSEEKRRISTFAIESIALTGKDYAETYEEGLKRTTQGSSSEARP